jgi:hypothetical protein
MSQYKEYKIIPVKNSDSHNTIQQDIAMQQIKIETQEDYTSTEYNVQETTSETPNTSTQFDTSTIEYNNYSAHNHDEILSKDDPIVNEQSDINPNIVDNKVIETTPSLVSTARPPTRCVPVYNPEKGDCHKQKSESSMRYMIQNANSLQPHTQTKWEGYLERLHHLQVTIVGLLETCTNWGHMETTKKFKDTIFKKSKGGSLTLSPIPTSYSKPYLPGGTLTLTLGKWRSYIEKKIIDKSDMGRWTGNTYRVHENNKLHIISAYRVCESKPSEDKSLSTYNQQYTALLAKGHKTPDPRQQVIEDLIVEINLLLKNNNDYLMIGMDANADIHSDKKGLQKLCRECELIDMYTTIHDEDDVFPTHTNGSKRIDFILCTSNLIKFVEKVGYIQFHQALDSDHRAVYCDIHHSILEPEEDHEITKMERLIGTNSTNREGVKYINELNNYLEYHKIFQKIDCIYNEVHGDTVINKQEIGEAVNKLDMMITNGMLSSEKHNCKKKTKAMWSPKLNESHYTVEFWNIVKKAYNEQIDASDRIEYILSKLSDETKKQFKNNKLDYEEALQEAIKLHNINLKNHFELRKEHLQSMADDFNDRSETNKSNTIKSLMKREESRNDFKKLRRIFKGSKGKGITTLEIPDPDNPTEWKMITIPTVCESKLITYNIGHFGQAQGTPFTNPALQDILGYNGTNEIATNLIFNQQQLQNYKDQPEYVQEILQKLCDGQQVKQINGEISLKNFVPDFVCGKNQQQHHPVTDISVITNYFSVCLFMIKKMKLVTSVLK